MKKTYKREMALVLFLWFAYLVETKGPEIVQLLVWPIFTFGALSFGIDWWGKSGGLRQSSQSPPVGGTERSSEYPSGENKRTDHWHIDRHGGPEAGKP